MSQPQELTPMRRPQPYIQRYPDRELMDTCELNCEEYGFLQRLRDFSMARGGIPDSEDTFKRLAKTFHISAYKLKKLWPVLENFFERREGFLVFPPDEEKRLQVIDGSHKRRVAGRLGASVRWSRNVAEFPKQDTDAPSNAISADGEVPMANNGIPEPPPDSRTIENIREPPPPPTPSIEPGGGGGVPLVSQLTEAEYSAVCQRAAAQGLQAPSRTLANRIRVRFAPLDFENFLRVLVRVPNQNSPGLWESINQENLIAEAQRQATPRKTNSGEVSESLTVRLRQMNAKE